MTIHFNWTISFLKKHLKLALYKMHFSKFLWNISHFIVYNLCILVKNKDVNKNIEEITTECDKMM